MTGWSPEVRVLRHPAATFRELAASPDRGRWMLVRRPLLLLFAMGMLLSLHSSGRLSVRAVADGMVSFAFLPACEILAVGVVYWRGDRRLRFARVVDAFFTSHAPWLLWIVGFCLWRFTESPLQASALSATAIRITTATLLVPAVWSAYLDLHFFRVVMPRRAGRAMTDLLLQRAIGWTGALGYFFGIAAWAQLVAWVRG